MVACTISTLAILGRTWRQVMPNGPRPIAVAARTKSRLHIASAAPRVTRANTGMLKMAMARIALRALAPSTEVIRMAISTAGKAKIRSEVRDSASSTQPPRAAAQAPSATPSDMPMRHRDQPDRDRGLRADHDARQHIAAEMVGAEQVLRRRRQQLEAHPQLVDRKGRPEERDQRRADEQQQQHGADLEADMAAGAGEEGAHAATRGRGSSST